MGARFVGGLGFVGRGESTREEFGIKVGARELYIIDETDALITRCAYMRAGEEEGGERGSGETSGKGGYGHLFFSTYVMCMYLRNCELILI